MGLAWGDFISLYGQSRVFYSMARDVFLPPLFSQVHLPVPHAVSRHGRHDGRVCSDGAAALPINILGRVVASIGTLMAFAVVCLGILVLRVQRPTAKRHFRTPFRVDRGALLGIFYVPAP